MNKKTCDFCHSTEQVKATLVADYIAELCSDCNPEPKMTIEQVWKVEAWLDCQNEIALQRLAA